jgi:hypothetical protein
MKIDRIVYLDPSTEIKMFSGLIRKVSELIDGDLILGSDGHPKTVMATFHGLSKMHTVCCEDGSCFTVGENHLLVLWSHVKKEHVTISVKEYFEMEDPEEYYISRYTEPSGVESSTSSSLGYDEIVIGFDVTGDPGVDVPLPFNGFVIRGGFVLGNLLVC